MINTKKNISVRALALANRWMNQEFRILCLNDLMPELHVHPASAGESKHEYK